MKKRRSTRKDAVTLGQATAIKSALQLLTPLALVRLLDQAEFGEYRLFWLIANTAVLLLAMSVDRSLLYFLPKSTEDERVRFVSQTLVYFLGAGLVAGLFLLTGSLWLPPNVGMLTEPGYLLALFVFLWISSSPIKLLPNADQNVVWQARVIIVIALLRAAIVVTVAWLTQDIQSVFLALVVWAALHWVVLTFYVGSRYGLKLPIPTVAGFRRQLKYAIPFGVSRMIAGIRARGEEWIVAYLFSPASLAVFSIGISFNVVLTLIRASLGNVLLPKMSKSHAGGNTERSLELNSRGNVSVVVFIAPTVAFIWICAEPLVRILYTQAYIEAVPVLRVYMVTLLVMSTELATVLMILEQGRHVAKVNAIVLILGLFVSFTGARLIGLTGAALGSLVSTVASRVLNYRHAARLLELPIRRLQDWATLSKIVLAATAAAVITATVLTTIADLGDILTLLVAAIVFSIAYALALMALGLVWLLKAMAERGEWR